MKSFEYEIKDELGLHARPVGMLVKKAKEFSSSITIKSDGKSGDAKKLFSLMAMGVACGNVVTVTVEGDDEESAASALELFFSDNL